MANNGWLDGKRDDPEFQRLCERESFIEDFLAEVERIMTEQRVTRTELARRMGCSQPNVTQLFRGRNLRAASMVDVAFHLGFRLCVTLEPISK